MGSWLWLLVVCLCVVAVQGATPTPLQQCKTQVEGLYDPISAIIRKASNDQLLTILEKTVSLYNLVDKKLTVNNLKTCLTYETNKMTVFELYQWLFSIQGKRTRADFKAAGGANIRMYGFALLSKIFEKLGAGRKAYMIQHLKHLDGITEVYKTEGEMKATIDEKDQKDDADWDTPPSYWSGPFWDPFQILEAQIYNFCKQWSHNDVRSTHYESVDKINTMNKVMHNILVYIHYLLEADDSFDKSSEGANFLFFLSNNQVLNVLYNISSTPDTFSKGEAKPIATYAKYLILKYFVNDPTEFPPPTPDSSFKVPQVLDIADKKTVFRTLKDKS